MSINEAKPADWDKVISKTYFKGREVPEFDVVEKPAHYNNAENIECIQAIKASMQPEAFKGYLKGNVEKYIWRYSYKNGVEDLRKARWYLERLIEEEL